MYYLLNKVQSLSYQFDNAGFYDGQQITVVRFSSVIGQISGLHCVYRSHKKACGGIVADVDVVREHMGREPIYNYLRVSMGDNEKYLIYDGYIEIPDELFWETTVDKYGSTVRKTRLGSFDDKAFDMVVNYFDNDGIKPLVNNCNKFFRGI